MCFAERLRNVTGIYAKASEDAKRVSLTKAVDAMMECVTKVKKVGTVNRVG